jgi:hypothetical protein
LPEEPPSKLSSSGDVVFPVCTDARGPVLVYLPAVTQRIGLMFLLSAMLASCASERPAAVVPTPDLTAELTAPQLWPSLDAAVVPPVGWKAEPPKKSPKHEHQVWLSPTGRTAYGVIRFSMQLPVSEEMALQMGVLPQMRRTEGDATLLWSKRDPAIDGLRFEAEGGIYRLRSSLRTRGWKGWVVYAGTLRNQEIVPEELELAELARENTRVGSASRPIR